MKFTDKSCPSNELLPKILNLGKDIIGCEIGISEALNLCQILENCNNIKKMYAIDPYLPYQDWWGYVSQDRLDTLKQHAFDNINSIDKMDIVEFLQLPSSKAVNFIHDNSLDFIFVDGDHSYEQSYEDFNLFYSKVKNGGIFAGHDYSLFGVNKSINQFLVEKNISDKNFNRISNDSWYFYKI